MLVYVVVGEGLLMVIVLLLFGDVCVIFVGVVILCLLFFGFDVVIMLLEEMCELWCMVLCVILFCMFVSGLLFMLIVYVG